MRVDKNSITEALHRERDFADMFLAALLARNMRYEADLVDQLFNSSERRLARVLLMLAEMGNKDEVEAAFPRISQGTLAQMVGTTRSRISFFMNRFRASGFVSYDGQSRLQIHSSRLSSILQD
jgi:CRP-like cAMP-binding protein